jgi:ABC-2 type transport system ATP-binding protein
LSFDVKAGRVFGFLGPNGAGKTTTIRMIVGITAPDEGTVELFGERVSNQTQIASVTCRKSAGFTKR